MPIDRAWTKAQLRANLEQVLSPAVCFRVFDLLRHPSANYASIGAAAMADPYVSSKIVAMANVAQGSNKLPILSLPRALQTLGTRHTHMVLMSIMLAAPLLDSRKREADPDLRRWVLALGAAGEWIGRHRPADPAAKTTAPRLPEEDLLAGLMLGLGVLILHAGLGPEYARVLGSPHTILDLRAAERQALGVGHDQVTLWALESMQCPMELGRWAAEAAGTAAPVEARAVEVLAAAIAQLDPGAAEAWLADALPRLGIDPLDLFAGQLALLRQRVAELAGVFDIDAGELGLRDHPRAFLLEAGDTMQSLLADKLTISEEMSSGLHHEAIAAIAHEAASLGADTDPLTGVLNRRGLDHWLRSEDASVPSPVALLVVDIDHFKQVNDHWGHAAGDLVLAEVARALRHISPHPLAVGRLGGDEFVGIYPAGDRADLATVAATVVAAVGRKPAGDRPAVTISVGAVIQPVSRLRHDWYQCLAEADALLYQAKNQGRNTAALGEDAA